jgi:endo-1,4-beta-xylanase
MSKKRLSKIFAIVLTAVLILPTMLVTVYAEETAQIKIGVAVIDGVIDEIWSNADELAVKKINPDPGADTGTTAYAKALWSDSDLYVLVVTNDANGINPPNDSVSVSDSIEVYVDIQNKKSEGYLEDGEFYYGVYAGGAVTELSEGAAYTDAALLQDCKSVVTGNQIVYEFKLPLDKLSNGKAAIAAGSKIGFDVQVNDDADAASPREAAYNWSDADNGAWEKTSALGTFTLSDVEAAPEIIVETEPATDVPAANTETDTAQTPPVVAAPQTGDSGFILIIFALSAIAATAIAAAVAKKLLRINK